MRQNVEISTDTDAAFGVPIVLNGERLAVKVIPGGPAVAGTLYIWTNQQ